MLCCVLLSKRLTPRDAALLRRSQGRLVGWFVGCVCVVVSASLCSCCGVLCCRVVDGCWRLLLVVVVCCWLRLVEVGLMLV